MPASALDSQTGANTTPAPSVLGQNASNVTATQNGVQTPSGQAPNTNTTTGQTDYTQRSAALTSSDANGVRKVALVGKYGAGTTNTWGGSTQASGTQTTYSSVVFNVTPQLSESGSMLAVDIGEIRSAGSIVIYLGSPARVFGITAKFVSRTAAEAQKTFESISILKAWRMPQSNQDEPETLRLFAYDKTLKGIPCFLQNYSVEWPEDVDYILATNGTPVPIIQTVNISLKEVRNWDDIRSFKYTDFKKGTLDQW
jgi:hypothetical protein